MALPLLILALPLALLALLRPRLHRGYIGPLEALLRARLLL